MPAQGEVSGMGRSLYVTSLFAVLVISGGWLGGLWAVNATTAVTAGGLTMHLPDNWAVLEVTTDQVLLAPRGLPQGQAVVIYLPSSGEASPGVDSFLATAPNRLLLFTTDEVDERQVRFRYVQVDANGGPDQVMRGRFVVLEGMAAVLFSPFEQLDRAELAFEQIIGSIE